VAWSEPDDGPLIATPIVVGNYLFLLSRDGTLTCFDAGTGIPIFSEKIVVGEEVPPAGGAPATGDVGAEPAVGDAGAEPAAAPPPAPTFTASPVAANGNLYVASDVGDIYVIEAGPFLRVASTHAIGEAVFATPAISDGYLLVRGQRHLFAFSR